MPPPTQSLSSSTSSTSILHTTHPSAHPYISSCIVFSSPTSSVFFRKLLTFVDPLVVYQGGMLLNMVVLVTMIHQIFELKVLVLQISIQVSLYLNRLETSRRRSASSSPSGSRLHEASVRPVCGGVEGCFNLPVFAGYVLYCSE